MSFFQPVCKGPALYRSKQDIIVALAPNHTISWRTVTSGYFILCALKRDFVGDSGSTYSLDKCHLTSGCKKKTKFYGTTVFFVFSGGTALGSLGFETSPLFLHFTLKRGLLIALQPRSQGLFPGFSRPAPKPGKRPWERGCADA